MKTVGLGLALAHATSWLLQCIFQVFSRAHWYFNYSKLLFQSSWRKVSLNLFFFFFTFLTAPHFTFLKTPIMCWHSHIHTLACLVNIHLHAAVSHGHGIVGQGVTGHLAVIGAADGGERARMAGAEWVSSLVWSVAVMTTEIRSILMNLTVSNRLVTFQHLWVIRWVLSTYVKDLMTHKVIKCVNMTLLASSNC